MFEVAYGGLEIDYYGGWKGRSPFKNNLPPSPFKETNLTECLKGASPLSINCLPLPLDKGKGIGLPNRDSNGVRLINDHR